MKIGKRVNAKKYKALREKQKQVNAMLSEAKARLKEDHRSIKTTKKKIAQFYHSRGLKVPARLSFKSLSTKDLKAYENLLDSILNDTFINKEKYEDFKEKMRDNFKEQFGDDFDSEEELFDFMDILESPIVKNLLDLGMSPSDFVELYQDYVAEGISDEEFLKMLADFNRDLNDDYTVDQFFVYAETWIDYYLDYKDHGKEWGFDNWRDYKDEYFIVERIL